MDFETKLLVAVAVVAAPLFVLFAIRAARWKSVWNAVVLELAKKHGLRFMDKIDSGYSHASGDVEGFSISLAGVGRLSTSGNQTRHARWFEIEIRGKLPSTFWANRPGKFEAPKVVDFSKPEAAIETLEDPTFDANAELRDPGPMISSILKDDEEARRLLLALLTRGGVIRRGCIELHKRGGWTDPAELKKVIEETMDLYKRLAAVSK